MAEQRREGRDVERAGASSGITGRSTPERIVRKTSSLPVCAFRRPSALGQSSRRPSTLAAASLSPRSLPRTSEASPSRRMTQCEEESDLRQALRRSVHYQLQAWTLLRPTLVDCRPSVSQLSVVSAGQPSHSSSIPVVLASHRNSICSGGEECGILTPVLTPRLLEHRRVRKHSTLQLINLPGEPSARVSTVDEIRKGTTSLSIPDGCASATGRFSVRTVSSFTGVMPPLRSQEVPEHHQHSARRRSQLYSGHASFDHHTSSIGTMSYTSRSAQSDGEEREDHISECTPECSASISSGEISPGARESLHSVPTFPGMLPRYESTLAVQQRQPPRHSKRGSVTLLTPPQRSSVRHQLHRQSACDSGFLSVPGSGASSGGRSGWRCSSQDGVSHMSGDTSSYWTDSTPSHTTFTINDPGRKPVCCGSARLAAHNLRKRLAPPCRWIVKRRLFQGTMLMCLALALFLPDLWVLIDRPTNDDLDAILTVVFLLFCTEFMLHSIGSFRTYMCSFFFWTDFLGTVSLLLDISYMPLYLTSAASEPGSNAVIVRSARVVKFGTRAGRIAKLVRLVKLVRYLPGWNQIQEGTGTAKVISSKLMSALSMQTSVLIILVVMGCPFFSAWTYPSEDGSIPAWLDVLEDGVIPPRNATFEEQLQSFVAFYEDLGYYPYRLVQRNGADSAAAGDLLPWASSRGAPSRTQNVVHDEGELLACDFDFTRPNQINSAVNISLLIATIIVMVTFSLALSSYISDQVIRPLDKLLTQVQAMASKIFRSIRDMASENGKDSVVLRSDSMSLDSDEEENVQTIGCETLLLARVVRKLTALGHLATSRIEVKDDGLGDADKHLLRAFQYSNTPESAAPTWTLRREDTGGVDGLVGEDSAEAASMQRMMLENAGLTLDLIHSNQLNPLELDRSRNHAAAMFFLGINNHGVPVDHPTMSSFLEAAEDGYVRNCPYHNWFHAVDVTHFVYRLLKICAGRLYLSESQAFGLLVSGICHDIGHPGLNNGFLAESSHELALRYNDKSPLENMHCAQLFELLEDPQRNILAKLQQQQVREVRRACIEAILHTDNAQHFAVLKEVQMFYQVNADILDAQHQHEQDGDGEDLGEFVPTTDALDIYRRPDTQQLFVRLLLHFADISNPMKPFRICKVWAWKIMEEFFMQGDQEKRLGLPVQALNDRDKVNSSFSQVGFIEYIAAPLAFAVLQVLPPTEPLAEQAVHNAHEWEKVWLAETKPTPSQEEQKTMEDRVAKLEEQLLQTLSEKVPGSARIGS